MVTVPTADHGDVTLPEPSWCAGGHPAEGYREDIEHQGVDVRLMVPTPCHGSVVAFTASFVQRPFSPSDARTLVTVELDEWHEFDQAGLDGLAAALVEHAAVLRHMSRELAYLRAGR